MKRIFLLSLLVFISVTAVAQDMSIRVMSYNLLNFPYVNNDPRVADFQAIQATIGADIMILQEIKNSSGIDQLVNTLNETGNTNYDRAPDYYSSGGGLGNMLIYNSDKLGFRYQTEIDSDTRSISHYALYVKDPGLTCHQDTIFIDCFGAHFKASQGSSNENRRLTQTQDMFSVINSLPSNHNIIVAGDLNFYKASEPAYEFILDDGHPQTFSDVQGYWERDDYSYRDVYTQSTRSSTHPGGSGGVPGGCDDRFDFIFFSDNIINNSHHIEYVTGSYDNIGNDGAHYNEALIAEPSPPLPDGSLNAEISDELVYHLFDMSDHLPVISDLAVSFPTGGGSADPEFAYIGGSNFCLNGTNPTVTHTTGSDGVYSYTGTGMLSLDAVTGAIDLSTSTVGTYTVTNTVAGCGGTSNASSVTITLSIGVDAEFSYIATTYCIEDDFPVVQHQTGIDGTYSFTTITPNANLSINAFTGEINLSNSTAGTFTIQNVVNNNCGNDIHETTITIDAPPEAAFNFTEGNNFNLCDNIETIVHITPINATLGTLSYTTTGGGTLALDPITGTINIANSSAGTFEVIHQVNNTCGTQTRNQTLTITPCLQDVTVRVSLFLQGNYDPSAGEMTTTLLDRQLLPLNQPYNTAPWNYSGTENVASLSEFPSNTVDWVLIELRDGDDPTIVVGQRAGILLVDGTVLATDGRLLSFAGLSSNKTYYIVARHRNHLDVIASQSISLPNNTAYNFSILSNVLADASDAEPVVPLGPGDYGLAAGDYSGDGLILVNDLNGYQQESATINAYKNGDFNLDRVVTVADFNLYLPNASKVGVSLVRY